MSNKFGQISIWFSYEEQRNSWKTELEKAVHKLKTEEGESQKISEKKENSKITVGADIQEIRLRFESEGSDWLELCAENGWLKIDIQEDLSLDIGIETLNIIDKTIPSPEF